MAKKDFAKINTERASRIKSDIEQATGKKGQQTTADAQEQEDRAAALRTQGRKGCRAIRINMAFTPDNHEFIKIMSKASGKTMTEFTNLVISAYQREHPEILANARAFLDTINSGAFSNLLDGGAEDDR